MENWLLHIALLKALKRAVQLFVSWIIAQNLGRFGVTVDPNKLTAEIYIGLEVLRNWLKGKLKLSWL